MGGHRVAHITQAQNLRRMVDDDRFEVSQLTLQCSELFHLLLHGIQLCADLGAVADGSINGSRHVAQMQQGDETDAASYDADAMPMHSSRCRYAQTTTRTAWVALGSRAQGAVADDMGY